MTGNRNAKRAALAAAAVAAALLTVAPATAQNAPGQVASIMTASGPISVQSITSSLEHPWGMAFLPDGRLLVTERPGRLRILSTDNTLSEPLAGTPEVFAVGQGGLLDVALDPDFAQNRLVYLSYAEPGPDGGASTALGRGRLEEDRLSDFEVLFRQQPKVAGENHFGGRIAFAGEQVFLTLGERFKFTPAQDLTGHLGTVVRLDRDGSVPADNPFVDQAGARPEIWSYGHRNIQAAAINPDTGALWVAEMGPLGGDELNLPVAGGNYGWPLVSWGINYNGTDIPDPTTRPEFGDALTYWSPVISPSGMIFYTGEVFPAWQGNALIGGLSAQDLVRLELDGVRVTGEERIPLGARVRDVEQGPDGFVYVLIDEADGDLWRLEPLPVSEALAR